MHVGISRSISLLLVAMLVVAGCGGGASKGGDSTNKAVSTPAAQPEPAKPAETPKEVQKVTVASGDKGSLLYLPFLVAEQLGLFKKEGIEVNVTEFKGGAQVAQALLGGEAQFGSTVTEAAPKAKAQSADLKVVGLYTRLPSSALLVDKRSADTIKTVADLRGKKVGVTSLGSGSYQSLLAILEKAGMTPADVEILGVGFDLGKAFQEGKVVAGVTYDPYITGITESGTGKILQYDLRTSKDTQALFGTDYPFGALLTRGDVIKSNPKLVASMVRAIVEADKWILSHSPEEIAKVIPAQYKADEATFVKALQNSKETISPDGLVSEAGMQSVITTLKQLKVIPDSVSVSPGEVIDMTFVRSGS